MSPSLIQHNPLTITNIILSLTDKSTSVGWQWDDATEKLELLGMAQKAEDSGANRLGATIIEDLRRRLQAP